MVTDGRQQLVDELVDAVWFRLALVLVPASRALGSSRPELARVKPAAYHVAGLYLRKMRTVYRREKRLSEWRAYLAKLREENRRRPRMIEVLDSLEGKPIVDS